MIKRRNDMEDLIRLSELNVGQRAVIKNIKLEYPLLKRVYDLGFLPEVEIECVQKAPSGSPVAFSIKRSIIALRKNDADMIFCEKNEGEKNERLR